MGVLKTIEKAQNYVTPEEQAEFEEYMSLGGSEDGMTDDDYIAETLKPIDDFMQEWEGRVRLDPWVSFDGSISFSTDVDNLEDDEQDVWEMLKDAENRGWKVDVEDIPQETLFWDIETGIKSPKNIASITAVDDYGKHYTTDTGVDPKQEEKRVMNLPDIWDSNRGEPTRKETEIMQEIPQYRNPDYFTTEYAPGFMVPSFTPDFSDKSEGEKLEMKNRFKDEIKQAISPAGAPNLPRPFIMAMTLQYFDDVDPEYAEYLRKTKHMDSYSMMQIKMDTLLGYLFKNISVEEAYSFWDNIVNYGVLPGMNYEQALDRYHNDVMGENIPTQYGNWLESYKSWMADRSPAEPGETEEQASITSGLIHIGKSARMMAYAA